MEISDFHSPHHPSLISTVLGRPSRRYPVYTQSWCYIFTNPFARAGCDTRSIFDAEVGIQNFPSPNLVAILRLKSPVCPTIVPIAGGRIVGFIPFPIVLVISEMQTALSSIWTRVTVSIFYDNYVTRTELMYISSCWSANTGTSMCISPFENVIDEFVITSLAVPQLQILV